MLHSPYTRSSVTTPQLVSAVMEPTIAEPTTAGDFSLDDPPPYASSLYEMRPTHGLACAPTILPKPKRDMNFAQKNTAAAKPGFQTPLAQYTAQMVVWLWFGRTSSHSYSPNASAIVNNPFDHPHQLANPLNPLQVAPSPGFTHFVADLLKITQVSHSVTLVSLLYIHRLKQRYRIDAGPGTEMRPFIASLILSNKYLDDNTYTNKTWADLTGLPVADIGKMETEFLKGLDYRLAVEKSDYEIWHHMLDGFILSRSQPGLHRSRFTPDYTYSPPNNPILTPATSYVPYTPHVPSPPDMRARSVSPSPYSPQDRAAFVTPYGYGRKRSAIDAFAGEPTSVDLYQRHAQARRTQVNAHQPIPQSANSGLNRSSSLNRRIARLGSFSTGRRGSAGSAHGGGLHMVQDDLTHVAANHAAQMSHERAVGHYGPEEEGTRWEWLVAPCEEHPEAHAIPPEQLVFYTISAQDGAPRKAILRHQQPQPQPHPYSYPPHAQPYSMASSSAPPHPMLTWHDYEHPAEVSPTTTYVPAIPNPNPTQTYYPEPDHTRYQPYPAHSRSSTVNSEPGQFADAGPPGYIYNPAMYAAGHPAELVYREQDQRRDPEHGSTANPGSNVNRWSTMSDEMMAHTHANGSGGAPYNGEQWRTRSEWSSPMPGYEGWRPPG